jgi:hypothetical protein
MAQRVDLRLCGGLFGSASGLLKAKNAPDLADHATCFAK